MIAVITGDIINSRKVNTPKIWLKPLKDLLNNFGRSPKIWEIYRGDSFQLILPNPEDSFMAALMLKAQIKSIKNLDVRLAIGIGEKKTTASKITESFGSAFIHSGEKFEEFKKIKQNLALKSPWPDIDEELNLMISLGLIAMNKWSVISAQIISLTLQNKSLSQKELGEKIHRTQSSISERQKRAHYAEIMALHHFYSQKIKQKISS